MAKATKKAAKKVAAKKPVKKSEPKKVQSKKSNTEFDYKFPNRQGLVHVKGEIVSSSGESLRIKLSADIQGLISVWKTGEVRSFQKSEISNQK
jgi:hypothetical protein